MKFVKFGIFALTMGLFVASCGNGETTETTETDSTEMMAPEMEVAPVDTMSAAPADSAAMMMSDTAAVAQ